MKGTSTTLLLNKKIEVRSPLIGGRGGRHFVSSMSGFCLRANGSSQFKGEQGCVAQGEFEADRQIPEFLD